MENNKYLDSDDAKKLWEDYFKEIDLLLKNAPDDQRNTIRNELESHVFEAMQEEVTGNELEELKAVFKDLGKPDDIVPPMLEGLIIEAARNSNNPIVILRVAIIHIGQGVATTLRAFTIIFLNLMGLTFLAMAVLKPFMPQNVGFFTDETGIPSIGIIGNTDQMTEHLGYFVIPIVLVFAYLLFEVSKRIVQRTAFGGR